MKIGKVLIFFIIIILTNVGCAMSLNSSKDNDNNFEKNNFIDEEKALMLAKQYIIDEGIDILNVKKIRLIDSKDSQYDAISKELFEVDWIFIVPTTFKVKMLQGLKWGIVYVNRKNGEVIYGGEGPS